MSSSKKYYALIKWIEDKSYTEGIPIEWIKDFDRDKFLSGEDTSESYIVEWRESKKEPELGWPVYDAYVIMISDKIHKLKNHLNVLDGIRSPRVMSSSAINIRENIRIEKKKNLQYDSRPVDDLSDTDEVTSNKKKLSSPGKDVTKNKKMAKNKFILPHAIQTNPLKIVDDESSDEDGSIYGKDVTKNKKMAKNKFILPHAIQTNPLKIVDDESPDEDESNEEIEISNQPTSPTLNISGVESLDRYGPSTSQHTLITSHPNVHKRSRDDLESGTEYTLTDLIKQMKKRDEYIEILVQELKKIKKDESKNDVRRPFYETHDFKNLKNAAHLGDGQFIEGRIEIGEEGSNVTVSDMKWTTAISQGSYTAMATSLVTTLFPLETLLKSNYKGGGRKIKTMDVPSIKLERLDKKIIEAIKYSVRMQYPQQFTASGFGSAINNKLNKLRAKHGVILNSSDSE
ncbi:hypothetical protein HCN44_000349 [Aphidius gifuensis]|uniref:BEN domain-containing protein n=1 Tax=Aphidius gifuensis TaxID=684658 RepID=A0A835CPE7_APHGI|nr:hypothetical protein HCN44_000349 [Aphidius gifuensis]